MKALVTIIILAATPVVAQDVTYSFAGSSTCADAQDNFRDKMDCVGQSAEACMDDTPGGYSTLGMNTCLFAEYDDWDALLNAVYGPLRDKLAEQDQAYGTPGIAKTADALRDMQRSWIAYRDATCDYERSKWGGGTGGGTAQAACLMQLTAEQALRLQADLEGE